MTTTTSTTTTGLSATATAWAPRLLSVFRIVMALLFLTHGLVKLFGFPPGAQPGQVPLMGLFGIAGVIELVGGAFVLIGFLTCPVAFILSGQMAVAYFMVHAPKSFYPAVNGGELAILFSFGFLYLAAAGAGPWSVDERRA